MHAQLQQATRLLKMGLALALYSVNPLKASVGTHMSHTGACRLLLAFRQHKLALLVLHCSDSHMHTLEQ